MKRIIKNIGIGLFAIFVSTSSFAREYKPEGQKSNNNNQSVGQNPGLAANCTPSKKVISLKYNNVTTPILSNGLLWQNRANGAAGYEVPASSGNYALYSGGLWLGGTDVNGQLKAAVSTFGNGNDFWTGPLDTTGNAEISPAVCDQYDKFDTLTKSSVREFVAYWAAVNSPDLNDDLAFAQYSIPEPIKLWPGNGDPSLSQSIRLAPFVDVDGDKRYQPEVAGDYPYYDLTGKVDCRAQRSSRSLTSSRPLFGDYTIWWVFNDKGNIHTESNAPGIGMEIHAQAFAFSTNDEINSMTFYNYELINRSTFTLTNTYFGSWVDPDLGYSADDYVGCDVNRGLGYCYNGDEDDETAAGQQGYGANPPAIGIDYFEGPYQDLDGINNNYGTGPGEALNGLGYYNPNDAEPDTIPDNERFGMRRFVYYNLGTADNGDPSASAHYYNYLRGIWKNGQRMSHGGNGFRGTGVEGIPTDFMFPGDSDPLLWGTNGVPVSNTNWTENNADGGQPNGVGDRRFLQSAGPFTLEPGNVNDITVGVVYARALSGGRLASVEKLFDADDKAQILFDNCFKVLNGPDAPDVSVQELDREILLYLTNPVTSNNYKELYEEEDPNIVTPQEMIDQQLFYDNKYRFQGYKIYQLKDVDVSVGDINDDSKARLIYQVDIKDDITTIVNFEYNEEIKANVPTVEVVGENQGIKHSFRVTTDLFASGDNRLVNFKTYYFVAIAYGFNQFKPYAQDVAPTPGDYFGADYSGQTKPYLASRQNGRGGSIQAVSAIPHKPFSELGGTVANSSYGDLVQISRLQGSGNGDFGIELTKSTLDRIGSTMNGDYPDTLTYKVGKAPIEVKIIDPLSVTEQKFFLKMKKPNSTDTVVTAQSSWIIYNANDFKDSITSDNTLSVNNEQIIPEWGISVSTYYGSVPGDRSLVTSNANGYIGASLTYDDPSKAWLGGIADQDGYNFYNWILSGQIAASDDDPAFNRFFSDKLIINASGNDFADPNEDYENILGGIIAPYTLTQYRKGNSTDGIVYNAPAATSQSVMDYNEIRFLSSTSIVLTKDKSKWTRCPVIELQEESQKAQGGAERHALRASPSVDKNGNFANPSDPVSSNPEDPNYISSTGMGWFPGYAVDLETGERLNMAFGEDSWYGRDNGSDMLWNPTSTETTGIQFAENLVWGGKHYVYVFRKTRPEELLYNVSPNYRYPSYDAGQKIVNVLKGNSSFDKNLAWASCNYVAIPMLLEGQELLATDATVTIQVNRPLGNYYTPLEGLPNDYEYLRNQGRPVYEFNTYGLGVTKGVKSAVEEALNEIRVVPNPYYAYSAYERGQLDNVVKITNLPDVANIKIYNLAGTLIRSYSKSSSDVQYVDWDLKNAANISIASGVYIVHVEVPGVGEKIIKWFGVMRPIDLNNF